MWRASFSVGNRSDVSQENVAGRGGITNEKKAEEKNKKDCRELFSYVYLQY